MKLIENGIDIPNKLLRDHEDGRVVFFCGAGVSKNGANKPNFLKLAKIIVGKLTSSPESQSKMYLGKLENCLEIEGFNGIIPIDHLFSLLEGEFERQDIEEVIYNELKIQIS